MSSKLEVVERFLKPKRQVVVDAKFDPSQEPLIQNMVKRRMRTMYQVSYCSIDDDEIAVDPYADQLMIHFNKLYSPKNCPVLRPVETSKRVFGYSRPDWYYTGRSAYQDEISKEGYVRFKVDFDKGISRLYGKKQRALLKKKEEEEKINAEKTLAEKTKAASDSKSKTCAICSDKFK